MFGGQIFWVFIISVSQLLSPSLFCNNLPNSLFICIKTTEKWWNVLLRAKWIRNCFSRSGRKRRGKCAKKEIHIAYIVQIKLHSMPFILPFIVRRRKKSHRSRGRRGPGGFLWASSFFSSSLIRSSSQNVLLKHGNMCARRCWRLMSLLEAVTACGHS